MRAVLVVMTLAVLALIGAGMAKASPSVPYEGGWCGPEKASTVEMVRYQGTVFVCTPPGYWTKAGGVR